MRDVIRIFNSEARYWTYQYPQQIVLHETGKTKNAIVDFHNFCTAILEQQSLAIGRPGKIVEIDESKFGKRMY